MLLKGAVTHEKDLTGKNLMQKKLLITTDNYGSKLVSEILFFPLSLPLWPELRS